MSKYGIWKRPFSYLVVSCVVIAAVLIYQYQNRIAVTKEQELQREFAKLGVPSETTLLEIRRHHKAGSAYITSQYTHSGTFDDIVKYYKTELESKGWNFHTRKLLPSGIEQVEFCKSDFGAELYHNANSPSTAKFWLDLTWHLNECG